MSAEFHVADSNNNTNRYRTTTTRRRRIAISQTDLISSSSIRPITNDDNKKNKKKKNFTTTSFRSLGCTASSQVSVPASIRSSANWEAKKVRKSNQMRNNNNNLITIDDLWCVPAIALSTTNDVDFDNNNKKKNNKNKKVNLRDERSSSSSSTRRMMSSYGFHHHVRTSPSQEGISEIGMIQNRLRMNGVQIGGLDQYEEWRLNVDNMSYEDLLELGERIGYVNTGLKEEEIIHCLRKIKISSGEEDLLTQSDRNCSICQEEYGEEDETGELDCGHFFHSHCIEQWLVRKNSCPICKTAAIAE